jgi:hypothetical protein
VYEWWIQHFPADYFENGKRIMNKDEKNYKTKTHHTNEHDIIHGGLNVQFFMAFLSDKKKKNVISNSKVIIASVSDIKKYDDAIKWGALHAEQALPNSYYRRMEAFILPYREEHKQAQKEGCTDKQEADPITSTMF